jgi:hypothetical protein
MDVDQDEELQVALAMSLQEYNNTRSPPANAGGQGGPSTQNPSAEANTNDAPDNKVNPPTTQGGAPSAPGANGSSATAKPRRRGKKLPQFAPSESEIDACFKELASNGRSHLTINDIIEVCGVFLVLF